MAFVRFIRNTSGMPPAVDKSCFPPGACHDAETRSLKNTHDARCACMKRRLASRGSITSCKVSQCYLKSLGDKMACGSARETLKTIRGRVPYTNDARRKITPKYGNILG